MQYNLSLNSFEGQYIPSKRSHISNCSTAVAWRYLLERWAPTRERVRERESLYVATALDS